MGIEQELRGLFLEESREHVTSLENDLLQLEGESAQGAIDSELINRIFRSAHTIKGGAGTVGFNDLMGFTHNTENVLDQVRNERLAVSQKLISLLLSCVDCISRMLDAATGDGAEPSDEEKAELVSRLDGYLGQAVETVAKVADQVTEVEVSEPAQPTSAKGRCKCFDVHMQLSDDVMESGTDPLMLIEELKDHGQVEVKAVQTDKIPSLEEMDPYQLYMSWDLTVTGEMSKEDLEGVFIFVDDDGAIKIAEASPEISDESTAAPVPIAADVVEKAKPAKTAVPRLATTKAAASIRVDTERLDRLVNLVGELVIGQARIAQECINGDPSPETVAAVESLDRVTRELQNEAMGMRMVPIGPTFAQFQRVVRDLALAQGKNVSLDIQGKETELDKSIIEKIGDPLKHMVRNSVDHGMESAEARIAAGKPEVGTVRLAAYHQEGNIVIEIADDGNGLNAQAIADKAIREGVIPEDHSLTEQQIHALIFHPGLSTAAVVTDVSGRGVGMDVVKRNIEELRGRVSIESTPGKGTTFKIVLPLTLAIIDGMALQVGNQVFLTPLLSIVESFRPLPEQLQDVSGRAEWVSLRGETVPLIRLGEVLGVGQSEEINVSESLVVVVEVSGGRYGLVVTDILGQQQVVIKPIEQHYKQVAGIAGASILVDGRVAMILDVSALVRIAFAEHAVA